MTPSWINEPSNTALAEGAADCTIAACPECGCAAADGAACDCPTAGSPAARIRVSLAEFLDGDLVALKASALGRLRLHGEVIA